MLEVLWPQPQQHCCPRYSIGRARPIFLLVHATRPCACLLGVGRRLEGGMKGEFLHPSLTAANDVPPQPCTKKVQPIAGRDTLVLRGGGGEESIGHVVEGTLEEEETSRSTLQCRSVHHHHHQAGTAAPDRKRAEVCGNRPRSSPCSPSSSKYLLHSLARHRSPAFPRHRNRG